MREAAIIDGNEIVNIIVIENGPAGDALLSESCVEITGLDPKPVLGRKWKYVDGVFVEPPDETTWDEIRRERDRLLRMSDWTQAVADSGLTTEQQALWAAYRQELRNIPETYATPQGVVWPVAPDGTGSPDYEVV